ncbi:MAG: response regulator [Phaeodactylibacter sp.]|nr:response regulator [Phaeodactylibacter sp.]
MSLQSKADDWPVSFPKACLLFIAWLCGGIQPFVYAQEEIRFETLTQANGLASNYTLCILQDYQGFLWVGTENGLNRFDGRNFLEFRFDPEDPQTLCDNWIATIYEDHRQRLWVGTLDGLNLLNRKSGKFERISCYDEAGKSLLVSPISLYEDSSQQLWITTRNDGLLRLSGNEQNKDIRAEVFAYGMPDSTASPSPRLRSVIHATEGKLWISTNLGIDRLDIETKNIYRIPFPGPPQLGLGDIETFQGVFDGKDRIIIRRGKELFYILPSMEEPQLQPLKVNFEQLPDKSSLAGGSFRIKTDEPGTIILSVGLDIYQIDLDSGDIYPLTGTPGSAEVHRTLPISSFFVDRKGNHWFTSFGEGIFLGGKAEQAFRFYQHDPTDPATLSDGPVRTAAMDDEGKLWIGVFDSGLDQFNYDQHHRLRKVRTIQSVPRQTNGLTGDRVVKIAKDQEGALWIATLEGGVNKFNPLDNSFQAFTDDPTQSASHSLSSNRVWDLALDRNGRIWAGTWADGLNRIDPASGVIKQYREKTDSSRSPCSDQIRSLYLDKDDILWIGTLYGLSRMDIKTEAFTHFFHDPKDLSSLSNGLIWCIFRDREDKLWVGTSVGLNQYDPATNSFKRYYEKDGLPSNRIYGLLEDGEGRLWVSTDNGLARKTHPSSPTAFRAFKAKDGLGSTGFLPRAHFLNEQNGQLYFGSTDGLLVVDPGLLHGNKPTFQFALHAFSTLDPGARQGKPVVNYFIDSHDEPIVLTHRDQLLDLTLADLSWNSKATSSYEYQLTGFNQQWLALGEDMKMRFTNLAPGDYTLWVRGIGLDNVPSDPVQLLAITVLPPWWKSWWAYALYLLTIFGLFFGSYRFLLNRHLQKMEVDNLRMLNELKNKLYTNITHEFRTPLTIINGMIEQVSGHDKVKQLIKRNSTSLLQLVNQILDLRKIEMGKLKIELVRGDIVLYLQYVLSSFEALAGLKGIQLHFLPNESEVWMDFDRERLLRVISNLLSNAIKFTPEKGNIYLALEIISAAEAIDSDQKILQIQVTDTGMGIPEDQQAHIFERFYQVENTTENDPGGAQMQMPYLGAGGGTGIGLALIKELISLMNGEIQVNSQLGIGTTFTIHLPIQQQAVKIDIHKAMLDDLDMQISNQINPEETETTLTSTVGKANSENPSLLIVEDNLDVMQYLISLLEDKYELLQAYDGQEGINLALEQIPDLIVSDVMMPVKNGYELCATLKQDERTSHIPIVLLTAKTGIESRIQGFEQGADAYLAKPFNQRELFIRLEKLVELRNQLRTRYQNLVPHAPSEVRAFQQQDAFMAKLRKVVESKMEDSRFGPSQLCDEIDISRSQLHLKLKALTNRSASSFIRSIRLQKAKTLLQSTELSVSQVAEKAGFNNLSYFSKKFTDEFGINPKKVSGGNL